jgi:hypothetical protein
VTKEAKVSNPVCSNQTLITDAACYVIPDISPAAQKALLIYAKVLQLAAMGGTDYTSSINTTLVSDAATLTCNMAPNQNDAARVALAFTNAAAKGASVPATMTLKMAQIACIVNLDPQTLDDIDLLLTCKFGQQKSYIQ